MKALIIGGAGFVGSYLIHQLHQEQQMEVVVTKMPHEVIEEPHTKVLDLNVLNREDIMVLLEAEKPDYIFHLAAQSSVSVSWKNPALTIDVNIKGSVNMLDAVRTMKGQPRVLLIGSGEEYGRILPGETPVTEDNKLRPGNIYAATKSCQNMIGQIYAQAYDMDIMMVRAFNHIGPNQAPLFVVADFCRQVALIEQGVQESVINVGNLSAKRDFTDVRDVVKAYVMLMEAGKSGETYNVGRGYAITIESLLQMILQQSSKSIEIKVAKEKLRPIDVPEIAADITKIQQCTGWKPEISLEQTIEETIQYWRRKVEKERESQLWEQV